MTSSQSNTSPKPPRVPLSAQLAELEREARWRRDVAAQLLARGHDEPECAPSQDAALAAAIATLKWLVANEDVVKEAAKAKAAAKS